MNRHLLVALAVSADLALGLVAARAVSRPEMRALVDGLNPSTGQPFGEDIEAIFTRS